ncbi:transaldolase [Pedobacter duraquae]|uniref:Transaldolase n=1 Tax=Pedobacter duraquae TaxID=425511 RepID=A0A4R6IGX5_9SPHI|nr:transaldolase [Pedobacter duraquae]TDO20987.1 transaldolase [Pedobacter duraquae]
METSKVKEIHNFDQSIWLDFIDRDIISSGKLQKLIDEDGVRGVTSNPAIFEKAISSSADYDADIARISAEQTESGNAADYEDVFYQLAISDIQKAADLFKPIYNDEEVKGADGYVSLEVSPRLALDTQGTIDQALDLWKKVDRDNVMIKIPGTAAGLPAIRQAISEGLNINVTLLFGLDRYREVAEAYISGLEDRLNDGFEIDEIASVASFFLSRIDVMIDPILDEKGLGDLKGEVAIASAKKAYEIYLDVFGTERWKALEAHGAKPQRLLWASTSSKNPAFKSTKYVDALIGPNTVDTIPMETLEAYRTDGEPANRLSDDLEGATKILDRVKEAGIDIDEITQKLEDEGVEKFIAPYDKLLKAIEDQVKK